MKQILLSILLVFIIFIGCNKDEFPDEFVIFGKWIEVTSSVEKTELDFKNDNDLTLDLINDTIRQYKYLLEKADELRIYQIPQFPNGIYNSHKVTYNKDKDQMTIFGLYPDNNGLPSETVLKRK